MFTSEHLQRLRSTSAPHRSFALGLAGACLVALVLCTSLLSVWTESSNHRVQAINSLGPETRVVVTGSSHVFATLNPALVHVPMMNLAAPVCSYVCVEGILRGNLPRLPNLDALVLEFDVVPLFYDTLRAYHGDYRQLLDLDPDISSMSISRWQKYELWRDRVLERSFLGPLLRYGKLTPEEVLHRFRGDRPVEDSVVAPGYANGPEVMPENDDGPARVARHLRESPGMSEASRNEAALRRLLDLALSKRLRIALMRFPHHPGYWAALPPEWQHHLEAVLAGLERDYPGAFSYWDFGLLPSLSEADYRNGDHVNDGAAARVTALFDERLATWLAEAQHRSGATGEKRASRAAER